MSSEPHDLLRSGRALLANPKADTHQLEKALMNIHSALEQHFRRSLASNSRVPLEIRASVSRSREIDWPQLLVLMATYGGLSTTHGDTIRRMNMIRNGIAHRGETYRGTRQDLVRYADLAESLITGRERSFAGAAMPDDLFDATMAALGRDAPPKQRAVGDTPRSTPAIPAPDAALHMRQGPAPARPRSPAAPRADEMPFVRNDRGDPQGVPYTAILIVVLIVVLLWLLFGSILRGPSQPPQPTPTLGLPTGIIARPLFLLAVLG